MNVVLKSILTFFLIFAWCTISAQTYDGAKGYSVYHKQDKSFISPNLRGKHSVSVGFVLGNNSPFGKDGETYMGTGFHLGYNYLILEQKKKVKKKKNKIKTRDVVKASIGVHADILSGGELLMNAKFYSPFLKVKGLVNSYYFFSEYGLGAHKLPAVLEDDQLKFNFSLEIIRIRFLKTPLYLHFNANYDLSNNFLNADRKNLGIMGGVRFYFYKNKYK